MFLKEHDSSRPGAESPAWWLLDATMLCLRLGRAPNLKISSRILWPGSQTTAVFMSWQIGGGRNMDHHVLHVAVDVIKESRELRLQPFNEYRKRFGLRPYTSFQELTGEQLFPGHGSLEGLAVK